MIKTQFDANIKVLRSDNGGLFSRDPQLYLQENIIESQTSCPYTPKQNRSCWEEESSSISEQVQALHSHFDSYLASDLEGHEWMLERVPSQLHA